MGNAARLIRALEALARDAKTRPLPARSLTAAASSGDADAVRRFVAGGADLEERTIGFVSPLAAAAGRGHLDVVKVLIESGASLDPEGGGFPLLAFPIANRQLEVVELILGAGAPVAKYRSDFRLAAKNGHWDVVDAMVGCGADPAWLDAAQRARLAAFVSRENPRSPAYRARLRAEQQRQLALSRVDPMRSGMSADERARVEREAIAEVERDPARARTKTSSGTSILALAAGCGSGDLVRALLAHGADPNAAGPAETPLARACARSDAALVETLLDAGADPNLASTGSPHPLLVAATAGSLACVDALLARGAKTRARDLKAAIDGAGGPDAARIVERLAPLQTPLAAQRRAAAAAAPGPEPAVADPEATRRAREEVADMGDSIEGQVFASSGSFENLTQTGIQMSVEIRGATWSGSVTKKTTVLVAGAKAGAKLEKAKALGIRVMTEAQFHALLERIPITEEMKRRYLG